MLARLLPCVWVRPRVFFWGGGRLRTQVNYLAGHTVIENANKAFGFNGWDSSILHLSTDYVSGNKTNSTYVLSGCWTYVHARQCVEWAIEFKCESMARPCRSALFSAQIFVSTRQHNRARVNRF